MLKSEWNGSTLPTTWRRASSGQRSQVIHYLQGRRLDGHDLLAPFWWDYLPAYERRQVILHLCAVGSLNPGQHDRIRAGGGPMVWHATRKAAEDRGSYVTISNSVELSSRERAIQAARDQLQVRQTAGMLYPKPNDGKRILPSLYTRLDDTWLRASGEFQIPATMNQGHLKATVNLLHESHGNLVDRVTELLGKMHAHLSNQPGMQARIVELFHDFENLTPAELYPILKVLMPLIKADPKPVVDEIPRLYPDNVF